MSLENSVSVSFAPPDQLFSFVREDMTHLEAFSPDVTRVILVRHGECLNNLKDIMGSLCPDDGNGLTSKGREQAATSGMKLHARIQTADVMMTSPNARAKETAQIFAAILGYPSDKIVIDARLQEEYYGPLEDKPFLQFKESLGTASRFIGGAPGGETGEQVKERVSRLFLEISKDPKLCGKTVLCFTHWFPIAQALRISGVAVEVLGDCKVPNGECLSFVLGTGKTE